MVEASKCGDGFGVVKSEYGEEAWFGSLSGEGNRLLLSGVWDYDGDGEDTRIRGLFLSSLHEIWMVKTLASGQVSIRVTLKQVHDLFDQFQRDRTVENGTYVLWLDLRELVRGTPEKRAKERRGYL